MELLYKDLIVNWLWVKVVCSIGHFDSGFDNFSDISTLFGIIAWMSLKMGSIPFTPNMFHIKDNSSQG